MTINEMADSLIENWGYESGWRIARNVVGDAVFWQAVVFVIQKRISA